MPWVIKYEGKHKSYFSQWTGIGPAFGARKKDSPRFHTKKDAEREILTMPITAGVMCKVEKVKK